MISSTLPCRNLSTKVSMSGTPAPTDWLGRKSTIQRISVLPVRMYSRSLRLQRSDRVDERNHCRELCAQSMAVLSAQFPASFGLEHRSWAEAVGNHQFSGRLESRYLPSSGG